MVPHPDDCIHLLEDNHNNYTKNNIDYRLLKNALGEGLLTSEGPYWMHQRRLIQPIFHRDRIAAFAPLMLEAANRVVEHWRPRAERGEPFDVAAEMTMVTLAIVA